MENPIDMDDLGVCTPILGKHHLLNFTHRRNKDRYRKIEDWSAMR